MSCGEETNTVKERCGILVSSHSPENMQNVLLGTVELTIDRNINGKSHLCLPGSSKLSQVPGCTPW